MHLSFPYLGHSVFINSSLFHICISLILNNSFSWNATSQGPPRYSVSAGNAKLKVCGALWAMGTRPPGSDGWIPDPKGSSVDGEEIPKGLATTRLGCIKTHVLIHGILSLYISTGDFWSINSILGHGYEGTKITEKTIRSLEDHTI